METLRTLFEQYGLLLVFGAVFVEQVGPPQLPPTLPSSGGGDEDRQRSEIYCRKTQN